VTRDADEARTAVQPGPWRVVEWKHANFGGTSLVFIYEPGEPFAVSTGPTPWGSGSWGPFPASAVVSVRSLRADDSWPVSGCPSERWTPAMLADALGYRRLSEGRADPREATLRAAIVAAEVRS